jgi:hypothetical protein
MVLIMLIHLNCGGADDSITPVQLKRALALGGMANRLQLWAGVERWCGVAAVESNRYPCEERRRRWCTLREATLTRSASKRRTHPSRGDFLSFTERISAA